MGTRHWPEDAEREVARLEAQLNTEKEARERAENAGLYCQHAIEEAERKAEELGRKVAEMERDYLRETQLTTELEESIFLLRDKAKGLEQRETYLSERVDELEEALQQAQAELSLATADAAGMRELLREARGHIPTHWRECYIGTLQLKSSTTISPAAYEELLACIKRIDDATHGIHEAALSPEAEQPDFCDANCTWRDHHPECKQGEQHKIMEQSDTEPCKRCMGRGWINKHVGCGKCFGTGKQPKARQAQQSGEKGDA